MKNYSVTKKVSFDLDDDAENGLALGNYLLNNDFIDILADNDKNSRRRGAAAAVAVMLLLMLLAGVAFWLYRFNKEADEVLKAANEQVLVQEDTFEEHSESEPLLPSFEYTVTDKGFIRIYTKPEDLGGEDSGRAFHPGACIYPLAVYVDTCSGEEWHSFSELTLPSTTTLERAHGRTCRYLSETAISLCTCLSRSELSQTRLRRIMTKFLQRRVFYDFIYDCISVWFSVF